MTDRIKELEEKLKVAMDALEYARKACLCEPGHTEGFDYDEEHPIFGKVSEVGGRWITPKEKIFFAINKIREGKS
jgi:hypothetical protein